MVELLVYIGIVGMLLGIGYVALYRCIDNATVLRRSADDVATALRLGERWRADVRGASGVIRIENRADKQTLHVPGSHGETTYEFSNGALFRRVDTGPLLRVLANVHASTMEADRRRQVVVWRWELELRPRSKASVKAPRMRPLFTFMAVAENGRSSALAPVAGAAQSQSELAEYRDSRGNRNN
jgi:hypothetical protein